MTDLLVNHKYHWDDILYIVRPFIYVYSVMIYGRKSYTPIKISLAIDLVTILLSVQRVMRALALEKRNKLKKGDLK